MGYSKKQKRDWSTNKSNGLKAELRAIFDNIAAMTDEVAANEALQEHVRASLFMSRSRYSIRNQMIIISESIRRQWRAYKADLVKKGELTAEAAKTLDMDATDFYPTFPKRAAGYEAWKKEGYQVAKDEKAIYIFGHPVVKDPVIDEETGETIKRGYSYCPLVRVFADWQLTEPIDVGTLEWAYTGDTSTDMVSALVDMAKDWGIEVVYTDTGTVMGVAVSNERFLLSDTMDNTGRFLVGVHELAHVRLGHADETVDDGLSYDQHEHQAELVTSLVGEYFGMDNAQTSANYLAIWQADGEALRNQYELVVGLAQEIIREVCERLESEKEAA